MELIITEGTADSVVLIALNSLKIHTKRPALAHVYATTQKQEYLAFII